jgi:meckelin
LFLVLPTKEQESLFSALIPVIFALKAIDLFYLILLQASYDVFFIDWERPKPSFTTNVNSINQAKNEATRNQGQTPKNDPTNEQNKVSCWRTLFVANEWNELQTYRQINSTIQLIATLFLLKVVDLESLSRRDYNHSLNQENTNNEYQAPFSSILRIGVVSSVFLSLGALQWVFYNFVYMRCFEDKIGEFIDFCSVSNISMFVMTHTQFGYYIHGRSPHGNADTNLQGMTMALVHEQEDMTAKRGLEPSSNHQVFSISVFSKLTVQYGKVMQPIRDVIFNL